MNTNNNTYTVIYTTVICVLVAAVLALVSQSLKPRQQANEKAETASQILAAAQFADKAELQKMGNAAIIKLYNDNIEKDAEVVSVSELKALNYKIKAGETVDIPTYKFKNGVKVIPVYGAGLWGPVWGYIAVDDADGISIVGAYFDHESETPGLGGKIKDDPSFRARFKGEKIGVQNPANPFDIVKGGSPEGNFEDSKVDAISGATMTSKGLDEAMDVWLGAYVKSLSKEE
jgi:Na+-transporting NADH:ubiquinone oxidoreductase subunit C